MSLHVYRPQRTRSGLLEKISVGREHLLGEVLERLARWRPGASRQHYLFIGPRGIGKTHVLRLIHHRVRSDPGLSSKWLPILLAEEHYSISRVSDLLLEMLRRLGEEPGMDAARDVYQQTRFDDDDKRVCDRCLDAFRQVYRETGRGVLLMMENLDRLLERQVRSPTEIRLLRKILLGEDWLVTLCTSPTFLNAVSQPEEPFFEFFDVRPLAELTADEQAEMLRRLADAEGDPEIVAEVERYRSRLRALYHFTGGSPRLALMLYDLVAHRQMGAVRNELDLLLDQLTPFYQDRMKEISEQEAKLVEVMALLPEGSTPTELAREARMDAKVVRATLTRLERAGYVRREERRKKRTVYIVPERLFRIWHQMNHSRAERGRVQYLLEFFASWYATPEERDQIWEELALAFEHGTQEHDEDLDDISDYMDYVAAISEGNERLERSFDRLRKMARSGRVDAIEEELRELDQELGEEGDYFLYKGYFLANELARHEAASEAFEAAVERKRDDLVAQFNRSVALEKARLRKEARDAYRQTAALLVPSADPEKLDSSRDILIQLLRESPDLQVVEVAGGLLQRLGFLPEADLIVTLRTAQEPWRRGAAATLLGRTESRAAVNPLIRALEDPASDVRGSAATALGRLGDPAAVQPLIRAFEDTADNVRGSAANALGRLGDLAAVQPLIRALEDTADNVRGSAADALGRLGDLAAVQPLSRAFEDTADNVRGSAANALGRLGDLAAVQLLVRALEDTADNVRGSAANALGRLGDSAAVQPLIRALEDPASNVRGSAAKALGRLGDPSAVQPLVRALEDPTSEVRGSVATALGRLGDPAAVQPLIRALEDPASNVRSSAANALGRLGDPAAVQPLIRALEDPASEVCSNAANALRLGEGVSSIYQIAASYLDSNRDPAVLERQYPEIREAVLLLVGAPDKGLDATLGTNQGSFL